MDRAGAYSTLEIDVEIPCDKIAAGARAATFRAGRRQRSVRCSTVGA